MRITDMNTMAKGLGGAVLLLALAACGSGLGSGGGGSSGSKPTGATTGSALVELGNGVGTSFKQGALKLQVGNLAAGGSTTVTANIVDANNANALYAQNITVAFTSNCASAGTANLTASVSTTNGTAIATYTAQGCSGKDVITASALVGSTTLTATVDITVASPTLGSMQFKGASPTSIGLKGMGGITASTVTFQVNDANGNPIQGVNVNFTLSTILGGISLTPSSQVTNNLGQVSTSVQAGSQHTAVGVTATTTLNGVTVTSGSSSIIISTGIPTANNFTLAVTSHNIEAWHIAGVDTDIVTIFLSDRFQNPAPDGTAVSVTTDGGAIETGSSASNLGGCVTSNGLCTVTLRSQEPWPDPTEHPDFTILGHVHIFAYTIGEESFNDANGNGLFDSTETFYDLPEAFQDRNEDGIYHASSPTDYFYDFNKNNSYDTADGLWEGVLCNAGNKCGGTSTGIGANECVVFSTSGANIGAASSTTLSHTAGSTVTFTVSDNNGEVLAAGTVISIAGQNISGVTLTLTPDTSTAGTFTVPDTGCAASRGANWPKTFTVTANPTSGATQFGGTFQLEVQSPSGTTTLSSDIVTIQ